MSRQTPPEIIAYVIACTLGMMVFFTRAEPTVPGLLDANAKLLALIVLLGVFTAGAIRVRKRIQQQVAQERGRA